MTSPLLITLLAIAAAFAACSNAGDDEPAKQTGTGGSASGSGSGGALGGRSGSGGSSGAITGTPAFQVEIETSGAATLCPGACTTLTASAERGVAPYTFTFDHDLGAGAGPHEVCPTESTTYRVTVRDSSSDSEEFQDKNPEVTQSIAISVDPAACSDGGAGDGGIASDAGPTTGGKPGIVSCHVTVATAEDPSASVNDNGFDIWNDNFGSKLAVDADDDVIVAASYRGDITLADGSELSTGDPENYAVLVAKLTSDCKPLWFASLKGNVDANYPLVAVDSKGQITVMALTSVQTVEGQYAHSNIYLAALSADGETLWQKQFQSAPGLDWQNVLRVDANDDIVLLTSAAGESDFGDGPLGQGVGLDPTIEVLAKFRPNGDIAWSKTLQPTPMRAAMAIRNGTDIVFHGWSEDARDWGAGGMTSGSGDMPGHQYMVRSSGGGEFEWSRVMEEGGAAEYRWRWLESDGPDQLVLFDLTDEGTLTRMTKNGDALWSQPVVDRAIGFGDDINKMVVDARGDIILGGNFRTRTSINGVLLTAPAEVNGDVFLQKIAAEDGEVIWTYQTSDAFGDDEILLGSATDSQRDVLAAIGAHRTDNEEAIEVVKVAR